MKISNRYEGEISWGNFKYMVYDIPNDKGTYRERYTKLGNAMLTSFICHLLPIS